MKYIITESQDNKMVERLTNGVKYNGWNETAKLVGGNESLIKLLKITSPMDFLHLFDDMDVVQSKQKPELTLFRYTPGQNLIIHEVEEGILYINDTDVWGILEEVFGLSYYGDIQKLIKVWLDDIYNLTEVEPNRIFSSLWNNWITSIL